jgi:hypothetical protein
VPGLCVEGFVAHFLSAPAFWFTRYLAVVPRSFYVATLVVRRRYLIVVPRSMPAAPRRYLIMVTRPLPAAPLAGRRRYF